MKARSFNILLLFFFLLFSRQLYAQQLSSSTYSSCNQFIRTDGRVLCQGSSGFLRVSMSSSITHESAEFESLQPGPPVYIVSFQVFGKTDTLALRAGSAALEYKQHSVAFEYIAPNSREEYAVRYRYMLEGLDSAWSTPTDRRYANYTHLPPGDYCFRVMARIGNGPWSPTPASFTFAIAAPLWARWWFICVGAISLFMALFGIYRLRVRHILELEQIRNRIAADLHDDIGSTLSSITVFSRLAEQEAAATLPSVAGILHRIGSSSQSILESLDDIIWMVKPGNEALDTIMLRIREYVTQICEAGGVALDISTPKTLDHYRMSLEDRRQLYLIVKEAINNIIKHAHCLHAVVSLAVHRKQLILTISDDGQGFEQSPGLRGDGLGNMQRRAKVMGGHLTIETVPQGGTTIILRTKIR